MTIGKCTKLTRRSQLQDKRVTAFKITDMNQSAVMGMLWLWRGNFKSGEPKMPTCPTGEDLPTTPPDYDNTTVEPVTPSNKAYSFE